MVQKPIFTFHYDDAARFVLLAFNEATGVTGYLVHIQGDNYPGSAARKLEEQYGRPIYKFLIVMQTWNPTKVLNLKRHALDQLKADLERAVRKEQGRTYYRRVKGCPGCK